MSKADKFWKMEQEVLAVRYPGIEFAWEDGIFTALCGDILISAELAHNLKDLSLIWEVEEICVDAIYRKVLPIYSEGHRIWARQQVKK